MADHAAWLPPGGRVDLHGRGRPWVWDSGGDADTPVVLLLHGFTSTAALTWCRCFKPLAEEFRVVAIDHRGHGRGIRGGHPFTLEDCADDAAALIATLRLGPVVAAGYSMGGPIAQLLWRRWPAAVRGLVLCSTAYRFETLPPSPGKAIAAAVVGFSLALLAVPPALREEALGRLVKRRPEYAGMAAWAQEEMVTGDPAAFVEAALALGRFDASGWIREVDVPVGIVMTEEDRTVAPLRQHALAASLRHAAVWRIPAGHRACIESVDDFVPALVAACRHAAGVDLVSAEADPEESSTA